MDRHIELQEKDLIVGIDLAAHEHQVVVCTAQGKRLTSFRVPHSRAGIDEILRRSRPQSWGREGGARFFAFEATGHVWEAIAFALAQKGERYVLVNPLATFRVREARQMDRQKTDLTDAEQIAELLRTGVVTRTQLLPADYLAVRRLHGEYARLQWERSRLKTLLAHQLYGFFPEFVSNWKDVACPGALAVLRTGLMPSDIAALAPTEFLAKVELHKRGRRTWRAKLLQVHERAVTTVAAPVALEAMAAEIQRLTVRIDMLSDQIDAVAKELERALEAIEEARYLRTMPGFGLATVAGLIAHVGPIDGYRHGRQLVKLAGVHPSRCESGAFAGRTRMTRRGRAGLRQVVYMATISSLQHNPRIRAHYDRLLQRSDRPLSKMQAVGACMVKLLLYAFAVMKKRQPFDIDHRWTEEKQMAA